MSRGQWVVTLVLILVGVVVLAYGILKPLVVAILVGGALVLAFGLRAAGARTLEVGTDPVTAKADFTEPPPTQPPRERGLILPPGADDGETTPESGSDR